MPCPQSASQHHIDIDGSRSSGSAAFSPACTAGTGAAEPTQPQRQGHEMGGGGETVGGLELPNDDDADNIAGGGQVAEEKGAGAVESDVQNDEDDEKFGFIDDLGDILNDPEELDDLIDQCVG